MRAPLCQATLMIVTVLALAGCNDQEAAPEDPAPKVTTGPAGLDVDQVNGARARFVAVCGELESRPAEPRDIRDLREGAATLTDAFRASPDKRFRRSPKTRKITMRELLRAAALVASQQCGDDAGAIAKRLQRTAARKAPVERRR